MVVVTEFVDLWCPNSRVGKEAQNRDDDGQPLSSALCMGEACAHWSWYQEDKKRGYCASLMKPIQTTQRPDDRLLAEVEFAWPLLENTAAVGDNITKQDVVDGLMEGRFSLILRPASAALLSHGEGFLRIGLAGGVMEEMHSIEKEAVEYAKALDYKYIEIIGRSGWERELLGYKRVAVVLRKEL